MCSPWAPRQNHYFPPYSIFALLFNALRLPDFLKNHLFPSFPSLILLRHYAIITPHGEHTEKGFQVAG